MNVGTGTTSLKKASLRNNHVMTHEKLSVKLPLFSSGLPFTRQVNLTADVSDLLVTCPDPALLAPSSFVNSPFDLHTHTHTHHTPRNGGETVCRLGQAPGDGFKKAEAILLCRIWSSCGL
jgi:hypothetical protein